MKIKSFMISMASATFFAAGLFSSAFAADGGIQIGQLKCEVAGGAGFIFGSSKDLTCSFTPADGNSPTESYTGEINKFGIDIGVTGKSVILWTVVAAEEAKYASGQLAGTYGGASASAAFAVGLGANVLVGGSSDAFALQPISISASEGVNVAVGLAQVVLK